MNNSIEYIKSVIASGRVAKDFPCNGWNDAEIIDPLQMLKKVFDVKPNENGEILTTVANRTHVIKYDPKASYDYFTSTRIVHDGTMVFTITAIKELLLKITSGNTYCADKAPENFKDFSVPARIAFTIGDIVILSKCGMNEINGNVIPSEKQTIAIPIKWEVLEWGTN